MLKDSSTHMHGLAVYVKEGLMLLTGFTSLSVLLLFPLSPSLSLSTIFGSISSNIDEVVLINPSANVFVFGHFNVHHMGWLTYSGGTDRLGEL